MSLLRQLLFFVHIARFGRPKFLRQLESLLEVFSIAASVYLDIRLFRNPIVTGIGANLLRHELSLRRLRRYVDRVVVLDHEENLRRLDVRLFDQVELLAE